MKKILIGTHNQGKFKEIAYLITKKYKKISPLALKIKSPKETGRSFSSNSKLKVNFFSKFVSYPVISDDSGICIKSLRNKPGIYSARLAEQKGGFREAMKFILKKLKKKKIERPLLFVAFPSKMLKVKSFLSKGKLTEKYQIQSEEIKVLDTTQFSFQIKGKSLLGRCPS